MKTQNAAQDNTVAAMKKLDLQLFAEPNADPAPIADPAPVTDPSPAPAPASDPAPAADPVPDNPPADPNPQPADPAQTQQDVLTDYKPTLPEGMKLDEAAFKDFLPIAKEIGLKPEQADKLLGMHGQVVQTVANRVVEDINNQCQTNYEAAIEQIKTDPVFGGTNFDQSMGAVNAMLTKYGDEKTQEQFQMAMTALAGFDKEAVGPFFNTVLKIAKDAGNDSTIRGFQPTQENSSYPGLPRGFKNNKMR